MKTRQITSIFATLSWWVIGIYFLSSFNNIVVADNTEPLPNWFIALALSWPLLILIGEVGEVIDKRVPPVGGFMELGIKIILSIIAILAVILFGRIFWEPITRWFTTFPDSLENNKLVQTIVGLIWLITGISILIPVIRADSENLESKPGLIRLAYSVRFLLGILWGILVSSLGLVMLIVGLSGA